MSKRRVIAFFLILAMLAASFPILSSDSIWNNKPQKTYQISVIARGKNTESWTAVWQGIEQAARDENVEVTPVYLSKENDAQEQMAMLEREVKNGAQAIVIAPADATALRIPIEEARKRIPIVTIESKIKDVPWIPYVGCNNEELGKQLAKQVLQGRSGKIAVMQSDLECSSNADRYAGFISALKKGNAQLAYWKMPEDSAKSYDLIKALLQNTDAKKAVALDSNALEILATAEKDLSPPGVSSVEIYGIGRTNQIVSLLEERVIKEIGLPNDYNIGYLGVKTAVNELNGNPQQSDTTIDFALIPYSDMYSKENQRLLFPFVK